MISEGTAGALLEDVAMLEVEDEDKREVVLDERMEDAESVDEEVDSLVEDIEVTVVETPDEVVEGSEHSKS